MLARRQPYRLTDYSGQATVAGVDVGNQCHIVIRERVDPDLPADELVLGNGWPRLWYADTIATPDDIPRVLRQFTVEAFAIDAGPELHTARQLVRADANRGWLVRYDRYGAEHEFERLTLPSVSMIHANRTLAIDEMVDRFHQGVADLPEHASGLGGKVRGGSGDYFRQLLAMHRTVKTNANGESTARWPKTNQADHFAHAEVYCMLAAAGGLRRCRSSGSSRACPSRVVPLD